ncbi:MAG: DUF2147 domain-containing protein [Bdellovibrionales bacterium]
MRRFLLFLAFFLVTSPLMAADDPLVGYWETEDKDGVIELYPCEAKFCGRFVWLEGDSVETPSLDDHNPDPAKRRQPLCGLTFLGDFEKEEGGYENGWIYSPRHGQHFSARLALEGKDELTLRGYVLLPIFGGTQIWKRVSKPNLCWALALPKRL